MMKIRYQLALTVFFFVLLVGVVGWVGIDYVASIHSQEVIEQIPHIRISDRIREHTEGQMLAAYDYIIFHDERYLHEYDNHHAAAHKYYAEHYDVACLPCTAMLDEWKAKDAKFDTIVSAALAKAIDDPSDDPSAQLSSLAEASLILDDMQILLSDMITLDEQYIDEGFATLEQRIDRTKHAILAMTLLAALAALAVGGMISKSITRRLDTLKAAAHDIEAGRLDHKVKVRHKDEIGELAESFERMRLGLHDRNELLQTMLDTFRGKFGNVATIIMRNQARQLVEKNPRVLKILPKELKESIAKKDSPLEEDKRD